MMMRMRWLALVTCAGCSFSIPGGTSGDAPTPSDAAIDGPRGDAAIADAAIDAPPDAAPMWIDIETLQVPCANQPVSSTSVLTAGVTYRLRVSTTCTLNVANGSLGDAEYYQWNIAPVADTSMGIDVGLAIDDTVVDGNRQPRWGAFTMSHAYQVDWVAAGGPLTAHFHDSNYSNNAGTLTLTIVALQ